MTKLKTSLYWRGAFWAGIRFLKNRTLSVFSRYERRLEKKIQSSEIPHHIAVIMDGNRRFAGRLGKTRSFGHAMGAEFTEKVIEWCYEIGVKQLTLYALSTENFQRSEEEVDGLFNLINQKFLKLYSDPKTHKNEMQVRVIGERSKLPGFLNESIERIEKSTEHYRKFHLNVAIAYGGRQEIIQAVRDIAGCVSSGKLSLEEVDENLISKYLYPAPGVSVPNVDLLFAQVVMRESLISFPGRLTEVNVQHTFVLLSGPNSEKSTFFAPLEYIRLEKPKRGRNTHIEF